MLITCPTCAAGYDVPDHLLEHHVQRLRCAHCATEWDVAALAPPELPLAPPPVAPQVMVTPPSSASLPPPPSVDAGPAITLSRKAPILGRAKAEPPRLAALAAAWVLSLVVVGSLGWGVYHWRSDVMTLWPPSQRAFGALGVK
jgi:predicted Zn finger-like uncharacterized protein